MIGQRASTRVAKITRQRGPDSETVRDRLAVEEPLEIRVRWVDDEGRLAIEPLAVTMRTPGNDFDLVAGFLHGEGVVRRVDELAEITYCRGNDSQEYNIVEARLSSGCVFDLERLRRNFFATSSCGVCGKASLQAVDVLTCAILPDGPVVDGRLLPELPERLLDGQATFARTGGLHGAGLFDAEGALRTVREDVGRHNAVDKAIGRALLDRALPGHDFILVVSGRASFELVQKAVVAGVSVFVAVGAPSSLAVDLARRFNQTLVGFARNGGYNVYSGKERIT